MSKRLTKESYAAKHGLNPKHVLWPAGWGTPKNTQADVSSNRTTKGSYAPTNAVIHPDGWKRKTSTPHNVKALIHGTIGRGIRKTDKDARYAESHKQGMTLMKGLKRAWSASVGRGDDVKKIAIWTAKAAILYQSLKDEIPHSLHPTIYGTYMAQLHSDTWWQTAVKAADFAATTHSTATHFLKTKPKHRRLLNRAEGKHSTRLKASRFKRTSKYASRTKRKSRKGTRKGSRKGFGWFYAD